MAERPDRLELELREKQHAEAERFRLLVESVRDYAIFMLDTKGRITSWNLGAERIKRYKASEIIGRHFSVFYPEEDVKKGKPDAELKIAASDGRYEEEGWRVRKDGERFWASVIITALRDPSGELAGFAKVTRDMTERRRVEEGLRQSEDRYRLLLESVRDGVFLLDPKGRITSWNKGAERIKGYRAEEVIGRSFGIFYPPEDLKRGKPELELRVAAEEGRFEDEGWRVRKDGTRFWAAVTISAVRDRKGELVAYSKVTRDLSDRKRMEETLRENEERYRTLVEELPDGVLFAVEGDVMFANPAARRQLAASLPTDLVGRPLSAFVHEEYRQIFDSFVLQAGRPTDIRHSTEQRFVRLDGTTFFAEVAATAVAYGGKSGVQVVVRDISDRKWAEEKLRSTLEDLRRANRELDEFAAFASHDLQEPLRKMSSFASLLDKEYHDRLDEKGREYTAYIIDAAVRMRALVIALLSYARLGHNDSPAFEPVDLREVLGRIVLDLEPAIAEAGAEVRLGELPKVAGNSGRLEQVFRNLIGNALKFRAQSRKPVVTVSAARRGRSWVVSVADNGIGFEQEAAERIFEPFKRLHARHEYAGSGLGLAICKKIVEWHGGAIEARSTPDEGAVFEVTLPEERP